MSKYKKKIFIIGGSGLVGEVLVKKLLLKDYIVINIDNNLLKIKSKNYFFIKKDISNLKNVKKNFNIITRKIGCPDMLVNCSYPNKFQIKNNSEFKKINFKSLEKNLNKHLGSYILTTTIILESMKKNKIAGSIVLFSSIYGIKAQDLSIYKNTNIKENPIYVVLKSGINGFVKSAASYYGNYGININSICPGGIENKSDQNFKLKKFTKAYKNKVPLKRFAKPDEIAECVLFLIDKDKSSYINGVNLAVDGGLSAI